jgi:hypothetical protein
MSNIIFNTDEHRLLILLTNSHDLYASLNISQFWIYSSFLCRPLRILPREKRHVNIYSFVVISSKLYDVSHSSFSLDNDSHFSIYE